MTTKTDGEHELADFEAWATDQYNLNRTDGAYTSLITRLVWEAYQAGRAALQSQDLTVDALAQEIRRANGNHTLGAGALAEALMPFLQSTRQSQDAERLDWLLRHLPGDAIRYCVGVIADTADIDEFREAIDHARRVEGDGE